jgi:L-amino acid N-acyltransferase YncA
MQKCTRVFTPDDYPALVDVINASWPAYPTTIEQLSAQDEAAQRHPEARFQRYVIEDAGNVVASGHYEQPPRFYEPGRFRVQIFVHPSYQEQGLGSHLYQQIINDLRELQAQSAWTRIREDMPAGIYFAGKYGFSEELRIWELRLDVPVFDPAPYTELAAAHGARGIEIKSLRELDSDIERDQKTYHLVREAGQDLPPTEHWTSPSYEEFQQELASRAPESYFVAVHEQSYVGLSYLTEHRMEKYCSIGLTGVRRVYRRQGIALALKLHGIAYARQLAYPTIRTSVDSANIASLALNERLGFVKQPAWIVFTKEIPDPKMSGIDKKSGI